MRLGRWGWGQLVNKAIAISIGLAFFAFQESVFANTDTEGCIQYLDVAPPVQGTQYFVVVDPYSSGEDIALGAQARGYHVLAIPSFPNLQAELSPEFKREFRGTYFPYIRDGAQLADMLRAYQPVSVVVGADAGVLVGNRLAATLGREFNFPFNTGVAAQINGATVLDPFQILKDKWEQTEYLRSLNDPSLGFIPQIGSNDPEEIVAWANRNEFFSTDSKMIVVKPRRAASAELVTPCKDADMVRKAVASILRAEGRHGSLADVVAQKAILTSEFAVNIVSLNGYHVVTDVWQYVKHFLLDGAGIVYGYDVLVPIVGEVKTKVIPYVFKILNLYGIQNGWTHTEVFLDQSGPMLVELNARIMGAKQHRVSKAAIGYSAVEVGLDAILDPDKFQKYPQFYEMKNNAIVVSLQAIRDGGVFNPELDPSIRDLEGYFNHHFKYRSGDRVTRTTNLKTILGQVEFVGSDLTGLMRSKDALRRMEEGHAFQIFSN